MQCLARARFSSRPGMNTRRLFALVRPGGKSFAWVAPRLASSNRISPPWASPSRDEALGETD